MNTILTIPFTLDREEIKSQLAIRPGSKYEASLEKILDDVEKIARPKAIYQVSYVKSLGIDTVTIEDTVFHSQAMRLNLEKIHRIFPFIVTCGTEVADTPIEKDDPLEDYWLRVISLSLVRISMEHLRQTVQDLYGLTNLSAMNPGSAEAGVWPIEEQPSLFGLFGGEQVVEQAIGVRLLPSYFMTPDMSASGILFPSDSTYVNCQLCQREDCPSRKADFDAVLWESIQRK
jgi:hypothetical protein